MELTEEAVQQEPWCGGMPVSVLASTSVVSRRSRRGGEGGEGPEETGVDEAVVLYEPAADEPLLAGGPGDGRGSGVRLQGPGVGEPRNGRPGGSRRARGNCLHPGLARGMSLNQPAHQILPRPPRPPRHFSKHADFSESGTAIPAQVRRQRQRQPRTRSSHDVALEAAAPVSMRYSAKFSPVPSPATPLTPCCTSRSRTSHSGPGHSGAGQRAGRRVERQMERVAR